MSKDNSANDPQWVKDLGKYTSYLGKTRDWYDTNIATARGHIPKFGPIVHHLLVGTAIWTAFTYLPLIGTAGTVLAYFVPFVYVFVQCFNPKIGEVAPPEPHTPPQSGVQAVDTEHHHDEHDDHSHDHHGHSHGGSTSNKPRFKDRDITATHPTAAALGAVVGAVALDLLYSPVVCQTEFMCTCHEHVILFLKGVCKQEVEDSMAAGTAIIAVLVTAAAGAIIITLAQHIAANIYDSIVEKKHHEPQRM